HWCKRRRDELGKHIVQRCQHVHRSTHSVSRRTPGPAKSSSLGKCDLHAKRTPVAPGGTQYRGADRSAICRWTVCGDLLPTHSDRRGQESAAEISPPGDSCVRTGYSSLNAYSHGP